VGVPYPRYRAHGTDYYCDICAHSKNEYSIVLNIQSCEHPHNLENQPNYSGKGTTTMDASKMLEMKHDVSDVRRSVVRMNHVPEARKCIPSATKGESTKDGYEIRRWSTLTCWVVLTFAKQVLTNQYKRRPKISLRIRMAKLRFPTTKAPLYFTA